MEKIKKIKLHRISYNSYYYYYFINMYVYLFTSLLIKFDRTFFTE